jgi:two-component system, chemotaxis family, sensor kinase CheA
VEDLSRFKQTYFDESAEFVAMAEAGLLRLTPGAVDADEVNAIFRAVHSIKGGGGAFGFTALVEFSHRFETLMDCVRTNTVPVTTELVDTLIRANDVLSQLLSYARDGVEPPPGHSDAVVAMLRRHLESGAVSAAEPPPDEGDGEFALFGDAMNVITAARAAAGDASDDDGGAAPTHDDEGDNEFGLFGDAMDQIAAARAAVDAILNEAINAPPSAKPTDGRSAKPTTKPAADGKIVWRIIFKPRGDLLLSGNEPAFMLRALKRLGDTVITLHDDRLPALDKLEPEQIYLWWSVEIVADASVGLAAVEDVFEFVADDCEVEITTDAAPPALTAPTMETVQETAKETAAPVVASAVAAPVPPPAAAPPAAPPPRAAAPGTGGGGGGGGITGHTIRVDLDKIDRLVNMVGEMVITQAMIAEHVRDLPPGSFQELQEGLEQLAQHTRELRESVMSIRAQPVSSVFSRMPRLVRELAGETGKEVQLVTSGENTEVDKTVVENLVDPMTHMIRNSIDHGLETPEDREAAGKPRQGTVHLSAQHRSGRIVIEVSDDGRGINRARVLSKAIEKGLVAPGSSLSDEEIDNLIFLPGFSTADKVSNISGRGVGMDVVRRNITSLGGRIGVYSTPGEGSRFVLSLPLTLAVLDGMVISVGEDRFVLPLTNIVESLRPKGEDLHGLVGQCDVMMARGEYIRLVYLHRLFGIERAVEDPTRALVVLVETEDGSRLGLVVDEVLGQQQVVIKSLEANFRRLDGVAAATILGDGRVALILDVAGLREMSRQMGSGVRNMAALPPPLVAVPEPA